MTIYLPTEPKLFQEAFNRACDRIIASKHDQVFYALYVDLIEALREHPITSPYLLELEATIEGSNREFIFASLTAFEEEWAWLWKMHPKYSAVRKALMRIRRTIIRPSSLSCTPLFHRINFSFLELRGLPSFCDLLKKINAQFRIFQGTVMPCIRQAVLIKPLKANIKSRSFIQLAHSEETTRINFTSIIRKLSEEISITSLKNRCRHTNECLMLYKRMHLASKNSIRGNDDFEKRRNMCIIAEMDPLFCWGRLRLLQKIWRFNEMITVPNSIKFVKEEWASIRETTWGSLWDLCDRMVCLRSKMALTNCLNGKGRRSIPSPFQHTEHQIYRENYEQFLQSLINHLLTNLEKREPMVQVISPSEYLSLADNSRINREKFVIEHAKKYRAEFPLETHQNVFTSYKSECPNHLRYGLTKWKKIIQDNHLDLRTAQEKRNHSGRPLKKPTQ